MENMTQLQQVRINIEAMMKGDKLTYVSGITVAERILCVLDRIERGENGIAECRSMTEEQMLILELTSCLQGISQNIAARVIKYSHSPHIRKLLEDLSEHANSVLDKTRSRRKMIVGVD